jgi:hypothetical protein
MRMVIEPRPRSRAVRAGPDLRDAAGAVSATVIKAAVAASQKLTSLGIPHAIIGGIAVGAHGAPRATKDVDFLVNERDAFSGKAILSFREGVPISAYDVSIDYLTPEGSPYVALLQSAITKAHVTKGLPVVQLIPLVVMKLHAGRRRDLDDVSRLLEQADVEDRVRKFLSANAPELLPKLYLALED